MDINHFYVTLVGYSEKSNFYFQLPQTINLYGDWQVGLKSISLNSNFKDALEEEDRTVYVKHTQSSIWAKLLLPDVSITSLTAIVQLLNETFQTDTEWHNSIKFAIDTKIKKFSVHINEGYDFQMSEFLSEIFQVPYGVTLKESFSTFISHQIDLSPPFLGVGTDIAGETIVNNSYEKFLKTVTLNNDWAQKGFKAEWSSPSMHPVRNKSFSSIEVSLSQIGGTPVKISAADVNLTLQFLQKNFHAP